MKADLPSALNTTRMIIPDRAPYPFRASSCATAICMLFLGVVATAQGQTPDSSESRHWALLIGVEQYEKAPPLSYTTNDVAKIANTLCERGGVSRTRVLEMVDGAIDKTLFPSKSNIMEQVPKFLTQPGPNDQVVIFFSGHGFRDEDDRMYLAPIDCDPADPAPGGIAVEWFRDQLSACKAELKLLVLDSCHAGSEKGDSQPGGVTAKDLGEPFRKLTGVITLASSTGDEKSQLWHEKQQSLFSYWFNQGLQGHADTNGDSQVDIDELNNYVHRNVTHTAQSLFSRPQTPVRIVRSGTPGVPVLLRLEPLTLKQLLGDVAEQLAYAMQERDLKKIGVLEFTNDTKIGELLGADFGVLGRYCASELQSRLTRLAAENYTVVSQRRLQAALRAKKMTIDQLGLPSALKELSASAGGMPVIALGTLRNRAGRVVNLQCTLIQTEVDAIAGMAGGTAMLNESEWAMLGRSVELRQDTRQAPGSGDLESDPTAQLVKRLDARSKDPHPMADPDARFRVHIKVNGKVREPTFKGNDMFVALRRGEVYEIWVENRSDQVAMLRLLVDGLSTLPQKVTDLKGIDTFEIAARVNLEDTRAWILDPKQARQWAVRGFVTETGTQGKLREFKVVDAAESLAARRQFTDDIGLITAAFYTASNARGGPIGTTFGKEREENISVRVDKRVGNLLSVINIRYVDPE